MASPQIQPTSWWPSTTLPPPRSTTTTVAASASLQPPANMDAIIALFQHLERRLDERLAAASWPPRPNPDPPYGMPWDCQPSSSWDLPPARPVSSWDLPQSRPQYDQHTQRFPSPSSPDPDAYDPNLCSNPSYWNYSDPYAYDPPVGRPLTSWDLPRPRIESYGGGGYAPNSHYGGGYSGGGYANERNPERNPYAPPPPPTRDSYYVRVPQPNPPSRPQPPQPDGDYVLAPSWMDPHAPWECPWQPSPTPPSRTEVVTCPSEPEIEKKERGRVSLSIDSKLVEEAGDSKVLDSAGTQHPNPIKAMIGSGNGGGDANNAVQSTAAFIKDDEREKILAFTADLMVYGSKAAKEGDDFVDEGAYAHSCCGWVFLHQAQEGAVPFSLITNTKSEGGRGGKGLKSQEVSRRSVICGIYALEEVYKDLLNSHLEDKVILKGWGS